MLQQSPNQPLPETIRVKVLKGFRAHVDGTFGIVNPDDVVDIPRALAFEMRAAGKAVMVDAPLKRQTNYLPARKKDGAKAADPVTKQLALLSEAVASLAKLVQGMAPAKT
jgi:hypothetical protein